MISITHNRAIKLIAGLGVAATLMGCAPQIKPTGTVYSDAEINRSKFIEGKDFHTKELEDLLAQAEAAAAAMGSYVPASAREKMQRVASEKAKIQEKVRAYLDANPGANLDTVLPETEISEDAFTWIQAAKEDMEDVPESGEDMVFDQVEEDTYVQTENGDVENKK